MPRLLIATDLDRTLLPNGRAQESPLARAHFARLAACPEVTLAYVTGRHRALVQEAMTAYSLPEPHWVISDVGSRLDRFDQGGWQPCAAWEQHISLDWHGSVAGDLQSLFEDLPQLVLQESDYQSAYKLSFYVPLGVDLEALKMAMLERLASHGAACSWIYSVDEAKDIGLLDILPAHATKLHAVEFLMQREGFDCGSTVFAGDSGNDLPILASAVPAVLVANAHADVIAEATAAARRCGHLQALYLARGGFMGMNGHYSAGILEGVAHFHPSMAAWLQEA
ncbi:HAD-IIB family hydrolase [Synechococcus sp. ATX 2A4]|nr:HAD-IIB family hydrolase [Synechococcus sp. ATX 2A4]